MHDYRDCKINSTRSHWLVLIETPGLLLGTDAVMAPFGIDFSLVLLIVIALT